MSAILALSVSSKIEQYGAYAGFASVLGLAVLSLLYFAQAREVKRLREWAGRAPERAAELQERVAADAQRRATTPPGAQPRPAAAPATAAAQQGVGAPAALAGAIPQKPAGAPAGPAPIAAPATAAAAAAAGTAAAQGAQATTVQPAAGPEANGDGPGEEALAKDGEAAKPAAPSPAVPAAAPAAPAAAAATAAGTAARSTAGGATQVARPGQPLRPPGSVAPAGPPPRRAAASGGGAPWPPKESGRGPRTTLAIVGGIAVAVALVVLVATQVLGGGGADTATAPQTNTIAPTPGTTAPDGTSTTPTASAVRPADVTVAVLNGTTVPGLARGVATRIENAGFKIGNVTNAADQARAATLVEYAPGKRREAQAVARRIGVGADAIKAMDSGTRVLAGQEAAVVVTVGSDQNQQSPQQ